MYIVVFILRGDWDRDRIDENLHTGGDHVSCAGSMSHICNLHHNKALWISGDRDGIDINLSTSKLHLICCTDQSYI